MEQYRIVAFISCLYLPLGFVLASADDPKTKMVDLTYDKLKALVVDPKNKIRSIDDLLTTLKKEHSEFLGNYHFAYASKSAQFASFEHPRTILTSPDGTFSMAFTGDPTEPGYETLEILQYIKKPHPQFLVREVNFPGKRKQGSSKKVDFNESGISRRTGQKCVTCHRDPPRPNWDAYNTWPGFYGSIHINPYEVALKGSLEERKYLEFMKTTRKKGRYKLLPPEMPLSLMKRLSKNRIGSDDPKGTLVTNANGYESKSDLVSAYSELNAARVAWLLQDFLRKKPEFKAAIFSVLNEECRDSSISDLLPLERRSKSLEDLRNSASRMLKADSKILQTELKPNENEARAKDSSYYLQGDETLDLIAGLEYILLAGGIKIDNWSMSPRTNRGKYNFSRSGSGQEFFSAIERALDSEISRFVEQHNITRSCEDWVRVSLSQLRASTSPGSCRQPPPTMPLKLPFKLFK